MSPHGLAAVALCECYGMTGDKTVGKAAQAALDYIEKAQDPDGGGWGYVPRQTGDTSATGWQLTALKSGHLANLKVAPAVFDKARTFLKSVSVSQQGNAEGGLFGYLDKTTAPRPSLTAIGLLCYQYLGMLRTDPTMIEGTAYLMKNQPDAGDRNIYYWYYATQVMHDRARARIGTLGTGSCGEFWSNHRPRTDAPTGSWEPKADVRDTREGRVVLTNFGGRVTQTSLSARLSKCITATCRSTNSMCWS